MGVVYEVLDRERNAHLALKTLRSLDAAAVGRFKREFRALADIHHRNLVSLGELFEEDGDWYFTMELVTGVDLLKYVRPAGSASGRLSPEDPTCVVRGPAAAARRLAFEPGARPEFDGVRLRAALAQLCEGLNALHRMHKVHRDLKPSNILVTYEDRVVILDFGVVIDACADGPIERDEIIGTVDFMAPEQAAGLAITAAADWYSVGVILYLALTGTVPFSGAGEDMLHLKQTLEPVAPGVLCAGIPTDLDALCVELLRIDPRLRPNGQEVLQRLRGRAEGTIVTVADRAGSDSSLPSITTPFVGRGSELTTLEQAYADSRAGRPVTVIIYGESGVGKTALVREFTERLGARSGPELLHLSGRCYEREAVPYKGIDEVVDELTRSLLRLPAEELDALLPVQAPLFQRVFLAFRRLPLDTRRSPPEALDARELRSMVFAGLRELFERLAARRPLVITIDDLQWSDNDSFALLQELLRPPRAPALLLVGTVRTASTVESPLQDPLSLLSRTRTRILPLRLEALPPDDSRALALALAQTRSDGPVDADSIARESGGHPLFIDALVRESRTRGRDATPVSLEDTLWLRIARLAGTARSLLEILAVAGAPLSLEAAAHASASDISEFDRLVSMLRLAHLVRTTGPRSTDLIEPYHDRIRRAVLAHLSLSSVRSWHGRLALALEETRRADPEKLAWHWRESGNLEHAAVCAVRAADQAAEALAFDRAARLYQSALELHDAESHASQALRIKLGDALVNAGRCADAAAVYLAAAERAQGEGELVLRRKAAEQWLRNGYIDAGTAEIRTVLARVGMELPRTHGRALLALLRRSLYLRLRGLRYRRRQASAIPPEELRRIDVCWSICCGLAMVDSLRGAEFQQRHLSLALAAGDPYRLARALAGQAIYCATGGGRTRRRSARLVMAARTLADELGDPQTAVWSLVAETVVSYQEGRFKEALAAADRVVDIARDRSLGMSWEVATVELRKIYCRVHLGQVAALCDELPRRIRDADERGDRYASTNFRFGHQVLAWLAQDDPAGARQAAEEAMREWSPGERIHLQHFYELLSLAQTDLYCGNARAALTRIDERWKPLERAYLLRVQQILLFMLQLRARAELAVANSVRDPERERLLRAAERDARRIERERMPWTDPMAALVRAGVARLRGQPEAALGCLDRAIAGFDAAGMNLYARMARLRRGQLVGGSEGTDQVGSALEWLKDQRVALPASLVAMLAPGFDDLSV
jgi:serine/threonine protein kinase